MSGQNNTELVINGLLAETINPVRINSRRDAVNAVTSLLKSELTPSNVRSCLRGLLDATTAQVVQIENKLDAARTLPRSCKARTRPSQ